MCQYHQLRVKEGHSSLWVLTLSRVLIAIGVSLVTATSTLAQWPPSQPTKGPATNQPLAQMFSDEIRLTLNACDDKGGVDLSSGASRDGSVICRRGDRRSLIPFREYLTTVSDFLSAAFLVGTRLALKESPQVKPDDLRKTMATVEGQNLLKQLLTTAATSSNPSLAQGSQRSVDVVVKEVLLRTKPFLQNPATLETLLGNPRQYTQVVQRFCMSPGMSVPEAQVAVPGLSAIQLYSICIQESDVSKKVTQPPKR